MSQDVVLFSELEYRIRDAARGVNQIRQAQRAAKTVQRILGVDLSKEAKEFAEYTALSVVKSVNALPSYATKVEFDR